MKEFYRKAIVEFVNLISNEDRLRKIYVVVKTLYNYEMEKKGAAHNGKA